MKLSSEEKVTAKKLALAAFAFTLLGIFCVYKMEIDLTLKAAVLGIAWLFGLAMVVACMAALGQSFNQWMLRHGATDAQWFFFTSEPKGLVEMREQLRAEKAKWRN